MTLLIHRPQLPLSDYVEMMWSWEGYHPPHAKERILPNGAMEITIDLSEVGFRIYDHKMGATTIHDMMVVGAQSDYFVIDTAQKMSLLSIWFKPGGARVFFGVKASELHNLHLPLHDLWGNLADHIYQQLRETNSASKRFTILEDALIARLQHAPQRHRAVHYALQTFRQVPLTRTINDVVDEIALSPTRFIQVFREDVGMTPKRFCRLLRFQRTLQHISKQTCPNWADLALQYGYYDQAHFINDFQAFAGITPAAYQPQSREHNMNVPL